MIRPVSQSLVGLAFMLLALPSVSAQIVGTNERPSLNEPPAIVKGLAISENLGERLPLDVPFKNDQGQEVRFGDVLKGDKPVVLNFAYNSCPVMCSTVLQQTIASLKQQKWTVGQEFRFVSVSIDHRDTPEVAAEKKALAIEQYGRGDEQGWHFLTGSKQSIESLTKAAGFPFRWDPVDSQYVHPGAMILLTPTGSVARYLIGINYPANDVRLGLLEASRGNTLDTVEQLLLFCYRYDREARGYVLFAENFMRAGGALVAVLLLGTLIMLWRRELRRGRDTGRDVLGGTAPMITQGEAVHP